MPRRRRRRRKNKYLLDIPLYYFTQPLQNVVINFSRRNLRRFHVIRKILLPHFPDDLICATWGEALCSFDLLNHRTRTWPEFSLFVHSIESAIEKELQTRTSNYYSEFSQFFSQKRNKLNSSYLSCNKMQKNRFSDIIQIFKYKLL